MPSQSKFHVHPDCPDDMFYKLNRKAAEASGIFPGAIPSDEYDAMTPEQRAEWSKDPVAYVEKRPSQGQLEKKEND